MKRLTPGRSFRSGEPLQPSDVELFDPRPDYHVPILPDDITEVSEKDLMMHFKQQVEWQNFFSTQVVVAEMAESDAEESMNEAKQHALLASGKKLNEARAERDTDPAVQAAIKLYQEARGRRKAFQVVMDNRQRCKEILSRELTRRTEGVPFSARVDRWTP